MLALVMYSNCLVPAPAYESPAMSQSLSTSGLSSLAGSLVLDHSANQRCLIRFKCQDGFRNTVIFQIITH